MTRSIPYNHFDLYHTLISGQTFEWFPTNVPLEWNGTINGQSIKLIQKGGKDKGDLVYESQNNLDNELIYYFGLKDNYLNYIQNISFDPYINKTLDKLMGLRVIRQDPWFCINSFIISQNNSVKNIQNALKNISNYVNKEETSNAYTFPEHSKVKNLTLEELMNCKTGYRAEYLMDFYNKLDQDPNFIEDIKLLDYTNAKEKLMTIKGIGEKVADCILLYGYSQYEAYPLDVHLRRATLECYFPNIEKEPSNKQLRKWAKEYWKDLGGFAHFFLFTYRRLYGEIKL